MKTSPGRIEAVRRSDAIEKAAPLRKLRAGAGLTTMPTLTRQAIRNAIVLLADAADELERSHRNLSQIEDRLAVLHIPKPLPERHYDDSKQTNSNRQLKKFPQTGWDKAWQSAMSEGAGTAGTSDMSRA